MLATFAARSLRTTRQFVVHAVRFSSKEPPFLVADDDTITDTSVVKVPVLRESVKQEIYSKHLEDPEKWSITSLAQHYRASKERIQAVLLLMRYRDDYMSKSQLKDIPSNWNAIYDKTLENPTIEHTVLADEFKVKVEEVGKILKVLKDHRTRLQNLASSEADMDRKLQTLAAIKVDTTFRETASNDDNNTTKSKNLYPQLFGDADKVKDRDDMLNNLSEKTKAKIVKDVNYYVESYQESSSSIKRPNVESNNVNRWKFAFRDLSFMNHKEYLSAERKSKEGVIPRILPSSTMIRTRTGKWRKANPLEEATRSWNPRPTDLDFKFNRNLIQKYLDDFDKDDHLLKEKLAIRKQRREQVANEKK